VVVVVLAVTVMSSHTITFADRLAETGDWLAGGTLALAAIAGLVALQAFASATGLPDLRISIGVEDLLRESVLLAPGAAFGPFDFFISLKNESTYSARNPAVALKFHGSHLGIFYSNGLQDEWTITDGEIGEKGEIRAMQWDGGPVYSIHGKSVRQIRLRVDLISFDAAPSIDTELLAEGYRRQIRLPMPLPYSGTEEPAKIEPRRKPVDEWW